MMLPGEKVLHKHGANLIVDPVAFGLKSINSQRIIKWAGLPDAEALGGRLFITNLRIAFSTHAANRITGITSVLLPAITGLAEDSKKWMKRMNLSIGDELTMTLVIWKIPIVMAEIRTAQSAVSPQMLSSALSEIERRPEKLGSVSLSNIGNLIRGPEDIKSIADFGEGLTSFDPFSLFSAAGVLGAMRRSALGNEPTPLPPAGWYPSPDGGSFDRWWDGEQWTARTMQRRQQ
jgi:hypothetical protein